MLNGKYKYRLTESWDGIIGHICFQEFSDDLETLINDFNDYRKTGDTCINYKLTIIDYRYKIIKEFDKDKVIK